MVEQAKSNDYLIYQTLMEKNGSDLVQKERKK